MDSFLLTGLQIGTIAVLVIEFVKLLPFIDENDKQAKRWAAFVICLLIIGIYGAFNRNLWNLQNFFGTLFTSLMSAFILYKTVVQGLEIKIRQTLLQRQEKAANNRIAQTK